MRKNKMKRFVYADNSATTKINEDVLAEMMPYLTEHYGNASSIYSVGRDSRRAVDAAREKVAKALGAKPQEIYFTAGGSESDNWAIKGSMDVLKAKGKTHIITTNFEHHAVLHTCQYMEKHGFEVTYLPVNSEGYVTPEQVEAAIQENTGLVTIMYANNEIGTIQPIAEIGAVCRKKKVLFHTDAVQAVGNVPIDVAAQNIDMLSLSGHKIYGPKGIGVLYIRTGVRVENLIHGGAQERNKRAGTENLAGIVGLGKAIELATADIPAKIAKVSKLRDHFIQEASKISHSRLNGGLEHRLCGNINMSFEAVEGEALLLMLDLNGICASSGSACTSGSLDPSHVLLAIGLPHEIAHGSLRISINEHTTQEDVDYMLEVLPQVIARLRDMSPVWDRVKDK
jgi:cysteine desulfurase